MHARVTTIQVQPGRLNDLVQVLQYSLLPTLTSLAGFQRALLLNSPEADRCVTVSLWATEAEMLASEQGGVFQMVRSGLLDALIATIRVERFEVGLQL